MTKKSFLEKTNNSKLAKKVLKQMTATWKEIIQYPQDYRDASCGIGGFIYYDDTIPFAKRNLVLIQNAINEFEQECGLLEKPTDECQYYNWLAWFALENTIHSIMCLTEQ